MRFVKFVPLLADLLESVFGGGTPKNILVAEMVGDQRMLEPGSIGYDADTGSVEAFFGELRQGSVQDGAPRIDRALLLGALLRSAARAGTRNRGILES
jgi:hypothetical protein